MKLFVAVLVSCWLAGCATPAAGPKGPSGERFFNDRLFAPASERIRASDVFALSDEMRRYLNEDIAEQALGKGRQQALIDALFTHGELRLEYDSELTRNAAQAFTARSGNCLSLVIMTAAFARALDLPIEYAKVFVDESWARAGDIYLSIGHVNVTLGRRLAEDKFGARRIIAAQREDGAVTVDFLPPRDARAVRSRPIRESIVVGMFMNNRAVEALTRGRTDDAYWWARESIVQAPELVTAYNTLGATYARKGALREAEVAYRHVLTVEPNNALALSNLVPVLEGLGRSEEARQLAARRDRVDPEPPFSQFHRGLAALQSGDVRAAKEAFAREVARDPYYHEFQYWLGVALLRNGDVEQARRHLALAMEYSTTRQDRELYSGKLARIAAPR
jgi:tetratricopeptide (TPR) repeat protein